MHGKTSFVLFALYTPTNHLFIKPLEIGHQLFIFIGSILHHMFQMLSIGRF